MPPSLPLLLMYTRLLLLALLVVLPSSSSAAAAGAGAAAPASKEEQGDTWVVLACTSRFWFNYRHVANALSFYRLVKRLGVPDSHIILMLADDMPCNARNARPGTVYKATKHDVDLCRDMEVDYKGDEVTVDNFMRLLTGRHGAADGGDEAWPLSRRLMSGNDSRVFLYMTGHGGDEFLKFHNHEEISSDDLANALEEMHEAGRFQELFFVVDTCQGGTLFKQFRTPGVLAMGSSGRGENSYAHQNDHNLGVALVDRFTDASCEYLHRLADPISSAGEKGEAEEELEPVLQYMEKLPLEMMLRSYNPTQLKSTPVLRTDLFNDGGAGLAGEGQGGEGGSTNKSAGKKLAQVPVTHFFAQSRRVTLMYDGNEEKEKQEQCEEEEEEEEILDMENGAAEEYSSSYHWAAVPLRPVAASASAPRERRSGEGEFTRAQEAQERLSKAGAVNAAAWCVLICWCAVSYSWW